VVHNDDTYSRILEFMGKRRAALLRHGALPDPERTGLFTTGIVAMTEGRTLALFFTGRKHAGENLAAVLNHRPPGMAPPTLICDGLDRNLPPEHEVVEGKRGSHARRHFVDQVENFPVECRYVLERLGKVFKIDETRRTEGLTAELRLRRHQEQSGPVMAELKGWMEAQLREKRVEPNSGLGEAMNYMLKQWEKLTLFLRVPGAPIHNNLCRARAEESDPSPNQLTFLSHPAGGHRRRRLHVAHPHDRARRRGCLPLPHGADAPPEGRGRESLRLAPLELPPDPRPQSRPFGSLTYTPLSRASSSTLAGSSRCDEGDYPLQASGLRRRDTR
jgi:hypothetical protein